MSKKLIFVFALFALTLSACSVSLASDITPPPTYKSPTPPAVQTTPVSLVPLFPPDPTAGAAIFPEKCAPCHGTTGMGNGPQAAQLPNPTAALGSLELARKVRPADWYNVVTNGRVDRFMMPFRSLTDRQRWDVVAYALTLSTPASVLQQGQAIFEAKCVSCHGAQGRGDGPTAVNLGAKVPDWRDPARLAQRSATDLFTTISKGAGNAMPAYANQYSEDERWALAAYTRSLSFAAPGASQSVAAGATPAAASTPVPAATQPAAGGTPAAATPQATVAPFKTAFKGKASMSSGVAVPANLKITLEGYDSMTQAWSATADVKADGTYRFEDVQVQSGRTFLATIEYQGVQFVSDPIHAADLKPGQDVDVALTISEVSSDTSSLSAQRMHVFFDFSQAGIIQVAELFIINNNGTKAVAPAADRPNLPVVRFEVPQGAQNLAFQDGQLGDGRYVQTDKGFGDLLAIRPKEQVEILFGYELPYTGSKQSFALPITIPVEQVVVMLPSGGVTVESGQLRSAGERDVQGTKIQMLTAGALTSGTKLEISLAGQPSGLSGTAGAAGTSSNELVIGIGAFGVVLVLAGVWLFRKRRSDEATEEEEEEDEEAEDEVANTPEALLDAIVALDDLHQAGQLPEEAYQQRRAELKARLKALRES